MAESLGCAGQIADGLTVIEEAIDRSEQTDERWCVAELLRIKGELLLSECGPDAAETAEDHFGQALDWARRQGALSWKLRAATSLARLWRDQNRTKAAREILPRCTIGSPRGLRRPISKRQNCFLTIYGRHSATR
jgi:predicted ATPase